MAKVMYPGTDVWLNNPLRPLEACGTSGMKAALNGVLNLSILDGWWPEYYDGQNGWAIPSADSAMDAAERDELEADALYDLLEHQVAPTFYERDGDEDLPRRWVKAIRHTLAVLSPELSADRMVRDYVERMYRPAQHYASLLAAKDYEKARELARWKERIHREWPRVAVTHVESGGLQQIPQVGDELHLRAHIALGGLEPSDVRVEVVYGQSRNGDELANTHVHPLTVEPHPNVTISDGSTLYTGTVTLERAGGFGYTVRVVPENDLLISSAEMGLVAVAR
jgi:starch phosphorylase